MYVINNRYLKTGVSTQKDELLERRPRTYCRLSEFLDKYVIANAKSHEQGLKFEAYLFAKLKNSSRFRWISVEEKDSSRGISLFYININRMNYFRRVCSNLRYCWK